MCTWVRNGYRKGDVFDCHSLGERGEGGGKKNFNIKENNCLLLPNNIMCASFASLLGRRKSDANHILCAVFASLLRFPVIFTASPLPAHMRRHRRKLCQYFLRWRRRRCLRRCLRRRPLRRPRRPLFLFLCFISYFYAAILYST